ncbi:pro-sigmaK processing inhibitor BofA family protein [Tuberibacillus sp. Marseille-P3662]|uniref:pro-sigmaK processing inhibitor BofA family protein n=1 Tax=Tuberibacillus sp. Marseille-P3662 TaxID=1965358 RepID=UPI000A1C9530|nr:pro-sigmaK processing inhibitor BofA family protein [Tuberibacillus sp. Marseille-P3662]
MDPVVVISIIVSLVAILLLVGAPFKPFRYIGKLAVKLMIGALLLFLLNTFGTHIGIHVPINAITTGIAGVLGIPGIAAMVVIKYSILV